jgi:hypothetical protein
LKEPLIKIYSNSQRLSTSEADYGSTSVKSFSRITGMQFNPSVPTFYQMELES